MFNVIFSYIDPLLYSIIDTHEVVSPINVIDTSKKVKLPNTGEIILFYRVFLLSFLVFITIGILCKYYKQIKRE